MAFASSQTNFEPSATAESIQGDVLRIGAAAEDVGLFYVDNLGAYAGSFGSSYKPAATDILVKAWGNSGPLVLRYLKNTSVSTIARGKYVESDGGAFSSATEGTGAEGITGVALCDVPAGEFAWFAIGGAAVADVAVASGTGDLLTLAASGELTATGANIGTGVATELSGGAGLQLVDLFRVTSI